MKKIIKSLAVVMSMIVGCCCSVACSGDGCSPSGEKIDKSKIQLYVFSYDGGYGSQWLDSVETRFEEMYKDVEFSGGRIGVQVVSEPVKSSVTADTIKNDKYEVYFIEGNEDYHILKNKNCFEDLTKIVTETSKYDNKKIEDKLTAEQKAYWGIQESDGVHYYALPHYEGYYGIIYNIDLFDQKGFYFAKDTTGGSKFIERGDNENKSLGPDGRTGVIDGVDYSLDDGLPSTYQEFYELCDYIKRQSITPIIWTGDAYDQYVTSLMHSLVVDYEGKEQTMLNYNFSGTATDLGKIVNRQFVKDGESTQITGQNAYELARQQGKYEAMRFVEKIIRTDRYHNSEAFTSLNQIATQERYLKASWGAGDGKHDACAMLVDGVWWENEAKATFTEMVQAHGTEASKDNRHFGWMYLPKANGDKVNEQGKNTLCDVLDSKCFVRSGLSEEDKNLALDFVRFVNSDEVLREFTVETGAPKALQYSLEDQDYAKLSPYAKSLYTYRKSADIVYPKSQNQIYVNNSTTFDRLKGLYASKVGGADLSTPVKGMHEHSAVTPEDYFTGVYTVFRDKKNIWKAL